jgi:hypothetical protein
LNERNVTRARLCRCALERARPVTGGRDAEVPAKRARKHLVTVEPDRDRHVQDGVVAGHELRRRALQLKTERILLRRLANHRPKRAMQMERRPPRARGQLIERRTSPSMANLLNDLEEISW